MEKLEGSRQQCIYCSRYIENVNAEEKQEMDRCENQCTYGLFIAKALLPCPVFRAKKQGTGIIDSLEA